LEDYISIFSPYVVESQKVLYKLAGTIISYTDYDGNVRGRNIEYFY